VKTSAKKKNQEYPSRTHLATMFTPETAKTSFRGGGLKVLKKREGATQIRGDKNEKKTRGKSAEIGKWGDKSRPPEPTVTNAVHAHIL